MNPRDRTGIPDLADTGPRKQICLEPKSELADAAILGRLHVRSPSASGCFTMRGGGAGTLRHAGGLGRKLSRGRTRAHA